MKLVKKKDPVSFPLICSELMLATLHYCVDELVDVSCFIARMSLLSMHMQENSGWNVGL